MNEKDINKLIDALSDAISPNIQGMDKQTYYSIREDIGISNNMSKFINYLMDIMEVYPNLKSMTLDDARWYLIDRQAQIEIKIQKELNVKE